MNSSRRVVRVRVAPLRMGLAAAGVALTLTGCSLTNPATIATPFPVADGRNGQIGGEPGVGGGVDGQNQGNGGIKLRNFLVVSQGAQQPGVVVGAISNDTGSPTQLSLTVSTPGSNGQQPLGTTTVDLRPGEFVQLGHPAGSGSSQGQNVWFQIDKVPLPTGSVLQLSARTPTLGGTSFDVPIQAPVDEYASLTPTAAESSPSASPSATGAQPTPSASG